LILAVHSVPFVQVFHSLSLIFLFVWGGGGRILQTAPPSPLLPLVSHASHVTVSALYNVTISSTQRTFLGPFCRWGNKLPRKTCN
jgi:hypothetical protein